MKYIIYALVTLFIIGCKTGSQPTVTSYPSWYLNPPQSNGSSLYGIGEGSDINSAKASALNSIASTLSVTVSSKFKKTETSRSFNGNEDAYHSALNTVKAEVKEMEFSDYKVIQNQITQGKALVLVEVSRRTLFNSQKTKLDLYYKELKDEQRTIKNHSPLKQALLYNKSIEKTQKLHSSALLTKTIDANFNTDEYMNFISKLKLSKENSLNRAKVTLINDKNSEIFVKIMKEGLNKAGIRTVSSRSNTKIYLKNSLQRDTVYGFKITKSDLSISTKDAKNKTIATNNIILSGKSRYDYRKAQQNSALILKKKIEENGIFKVLGIE